MKFKKIISAAVGAAMLCASLPTSGAVVNLTDNTLKANAVDEPYSESEYPSESYYYGSEDTSEEASWVEESSEAPQESAVTWARTTTTHAINYEIDPSSAITSDSYCVYFFSVEKSFDKLTACLKFTGGTPKGVTYQYDGKAVAGPCDVWAYEWNSHAHKYDLTVLADGVIAGTVTVYIGVKGDANLDDTVDSKDAVAVLDTYAYALLDMNKSLQTDASLENLANYLADIDNESLDFDEIRSKDAMYILQFFAMDIAGQNPSWINVCKDLADAGKVYSLDNSSYFEPNFGASSANTVITVGSVAVKPGTKTVSVPVTISGNEVFACFGFVFGYDKKINFKNCGEGLIYKPEIANANNFLATTVARSEDVKDDGVLFTLEFEIPADAKAGEEFKIEPSLGQFCESGGRDVAVKLVDGAIKVSDNAEETTEPTTSISETETTTTTTMTKPTTTTTTIATSTTEKTTSTTKMESTATTTTVTTDSKEVKLGDINGDEKIDSKDAVLVLKSYAESLVNGKKSTDLTGDINNDGSVDSKDAVIILKYYAATLTGFEGNISEFNK